MNNEIFLKVVLVVSMMISLSGCSNSIPRDTPAIVETPTVVETPTIVDTPSENATFVKMYASQDVNMRVGASTSSPIIKIIIGGESVKVYSTTEGWSKIENNNQEGYVNASFLTKGKSLSYEQRALEIIKTMTIEKRSDKCF